MPDVPVGARTGGHGEAGSAGGLEKVSCAVQDLSQQVCLLKEELRSSLREVQGEQAVLRRRCQSLCESACRAAEQQSLLESRVAGLEHEQEAAARLSANSFEALSTRLTEHGVELASWPPVQEVRAVLERADEAARRLEGRIAGLESDREPAAQASARAERRAAELEAALDRCQSELEVAGRLSQQQTLRVSEDAEALRTVLDRVLEEGLASRRELEELRRKLEQQGQARQRDFEGAKAQLSDICRCELEQLRSKLGQDCEAFRHELEEQRQKLLQATEHGQRCQNDVQSLRYLLQLGGEQRPCQLCTDPQHWSERHLSVWLAEHGLPAEVCQSFEAHLVNGQLALELREEELAGMGITDDLLQRRVLRELDNLFEQSICTRGTKLNPVGKYANGTRPLTPCQRRLPRPQSARPHGSPRMSSSLVKLAQTDLSGGKRPRPPVSARQRSAQEAASTAMAGGFAASTLLFRSPLLRPLRPVRPPSAGTPPSCGPEAEEAGPEETHAALEPDHSPQRQDADRGDRLVERRLRQGSPCAGGEEGGGEAPVL